MSREKEPAFIIETIIDGHSVAKVLDMMAGICGQKAEHIRENWQDEPLARRWDRASKRLHTASIAFRKLGL